MTIDTSKEIRAEFLSKWITVKKMREIISDLADDVELYPNRLGNLSVIHKGTYIGFIDLSDETFHRVKV